MKLESESLLFLSCYLHSSPSRSLSSFSLLSDFVGGGRLHGVVLASHKACCWWSLQRVSLLFPGSLEWRGSFGSLAVSPL